MDPFTIVLDFSFDDVIKYNEIVYVVKSMEERKMTRCCGNAKEGG